VISSDYLDALLVEQREHLLGNEEKVAFRQTDGYGGDDGLQNSQPGRVRQCFFAAAFVLFRFEAGIGFRRLLLGMTDGQFTWVQTFRTSPISRWKTKPESRTSS
jgi:hypothetical protein